MPGDGSRALREVRRRASAVAQGAGGAVQGGLALLRADRNLQHQPRPEESRRVRRARSLSARQEANCAIPQRHRLVQSRRASGIHGDRTKCPHLGTRWNRLPILEAIVLGIVQGLTEFLPVSSTAHLALVPWLVTRLGLANWSDPGLTFDVALHAGTLFAILLYFWRTWIQIIRAALGGKVVRFSETSDNMRDLTPEEQAASGNCCGT